MYENQDVYIGDFINSSKHGKGILIHCQGKRQYEGDFVNDLFGGFGLLTYNDADEKFLKYEGSFIGFNTIIKLSNSFILSISAGQFKQGMFHGPGKLSLRNGDTYTGSFKQSLYHGHGELVVVIPNTKIKSKTDTDSSKPNSSSNTQISVNLRRNSVMSVDNTNNKNETSKPIIGSEDGVTSSSSVNTQRNRKFKTIVYTGSWFKGFPKGKMKIVNSKTGDVYDGDMDRLYHGFGRIEYRGGALGWYEGEFRRGEYHGKGIRVYINGNRYEGIIIILQI